MVHEIYEYAHTKSSLVVFTLIFLLHLKETHFDFSQKAQKVKGDKIIHHTFLAHVLGVHSVWNIICKFILQHLI